MTNDTNILGSADQYDADECFDDVAPKHVSVPRAAQVAAAQEILKQAQAQRLPPPMLEVTPSDRDVGEVTPEDVLGELLGIAESDEPDEPGESSEPAPFTPVMTQDFPIVQTIYRRFKAAMPAPKVMRVDTEDSYDKFLNSKRAPYAADLEQRVAALESQLAEHVVDNHGGGRVDTIEKALKKHASDGHGVPISVLGEEVEHAKRRAEICGDEIIMSLPPGTEKNVKAWQDGEDIYCSMRLPGPDGKARIATSSTPVARHVEEVLGYAMDAGVDPVEVMGAVPMLAQILGAGALITQISRAAPDLLAQKSVRNGKSFVGKVTPIADPAVAAMMSLMQMAEKGDRRAIKELRKLKAMPDSKNLFAAAEKGFERAKGNV